MLREETLRRSQAWEVKRGMADDRRGWAQVLDQEAREGAAAFEVVRVRRVYEPPLVEDGQRVLVDRLWPRGLAKEAARVDAWLREVAPSDELRRWYGHEPERWEEFTRRYRAELEGEEQQRALDDLVRRARAGRLTLLCAARDVARSNAEVVRQVVLERLGGGGRPVGGKARPVVAGPASGRMLPWFALPAADGGQAGSAALRGRANLVVLLHHGAGCAACERVLQELAGAVERFGEEEGAVLAVGPDEGAALGEQAARLGWAYPLLSDPRMEVAARLGWGAPTLVVSDRFGEIWALWDGGGTHALPGAEEVGEWLGFIERQCPECGVAEWPGAGT